MTTSLSPTIEPHLTCAFAVQSSPGAYAVLLGAGASVGAGVPSAWGVQEELIRRLASQERADCSDDPFAWYERRSGKPSTYDDLLAALTHTQVERQALLRGFFKPTQEDRDEGLKEPTTAHRALARLVSGGRVRIVLTTNFDRLVETALRDEGIEPTVVTGPAELIGLNPLHAQRCLVVHLHGDYLNPTGMLNTAEELGAYPPEVDNLLDKIFSEYGLIIVGWSATWDRALRTAITRNPNRFYATYWVDPSTLSEVAEDLRTQRQAVYVRADADTFLGQVVDGCEALADTGRRHPITTAVAVATAKRALTGEYKPVRLHDTIRAEIERLRVLDVLDPVNVNNPDAGDYTARLARLEAALEVPQALVATAAHWGDTATDGWWFDDIARFAKRPYISGTTSFINLIQAPATALLYAAGIAAAGARRCDLVYRLLTEPMTTDNSEKDVPVSTELAPHRVFRQTRAHRLLHEQLRPLIAGYLSLGDAAYLDASERFEYVRLVHAIFLQLKATNRHREGPNWDEKISQLKQSLADEPPGSKATEELTAQLATAQSEADTARSKRRHAVRLNVPHIRAIGHLDQYQPAPAPLLAAEIAREGRDHPLLRAGLCDHDPTQMKWAMIAVNDAFAHFANESAWSTVSPTGGVLPSEMFYPDETPKWARNGL